MVTITLTSNQIAELAEAVAVVLATRPAPPPPAEPVCYTVRQFAERLGVCDRTIHRRVTAGQIARVPGLGSAIRIPASELDRILSGRANG